MNEETFRWTITAGVAIAALSILVMAVAVIAMARVFAKLQAKVDELNESVQPIIGTVTRLTQQNAPKISEIADNARDISANAKDVSDVAKDQAHRWADVGRDAADRTKAQVARVDATVDETIEQLHVAGENVKTAVAKPMREMSGVAAGIKAGFTAFAQAQKSGVDRIAQDEEMFI